MENSVENKAENPAISQIIKEYFGLILTSIRFSL